MSPTLVYTGGFGNIYEGRLIRGWKKVAIKCSRFQTSHTNKALSALETVVRELYIWLQLDHANIVNLHGLARFQGCVAMVSPWMNNGNVREFIRERPSTNRYLLCYYVASGLEYLHGVDVIHGDLKGANVLIDDNGVAKITDFGNAIILKETSVRFPASDTSRSALSLRWATILVRIVPLHTYPEALK
ncbi:hypothetical protein FS749_000167 [Ceratobasidium sp. UAMH 11750]|nr:hypothetical protein FS749_000167 [Ceratobasidium sp. UAMH 11750]